MKKENKIDFRAETVAEEYAELAGRMKAFEAYLRTEESALVEKKVCFAMLGLCTKESE